MLEITKFTLDYNGIYSISFDGKEFYTYFTLSTLLKMLKIEGLGIDDIDSEYDLFKPIEFKKVTLIANIKKENKGLSWSTEFLEWLVFDNDFELPVITVELKENHV